MAGGFSTPKKDEQLKASGGQKVKTGQILVRGINTYKVGKNVRGSGTVFSLVCGTVYFTRKKTPHGKVRTFINVMPEKTKK